MSNSNKLLNRKKKRDNGVSISRNNKEADDDNLLRFNEENNSDSEKVDEKKRDDSEESTPELPQLSINKILEEDNKEEVKEKPSKITKKKDKENKSVSILEKDLIQFPTIVEIISGTKNTTQSSHVNELIKNNKKNKNFLSDNNTYPWIKRNSLSKQYNGMLKLHYEILEFYEFIKPNAEEIEQRNKVYEYIEKVIKDHWPNWKIEKYGSFTTNLSLPDSDIDLVIAPDTKQTDIEKLLKKISDVFISENKFSYIEVIKARVPIIKATYKENGINIDISIMKPHFEENKKSIEKILNEYPYMRPLIYVLKYFLRQKKLNELHTGGISSFVLFNMVFAYILYVQKDKAEHSHSTRLLTLGHLLVGFFQFYAFEFNYDYVGISVRHGGYFYKREKKEFAGQSAVGKNLLSMENFQDLNQDLGRNCFKFIKVIDSFKLARDALYYPCNYPIESYLGMFITIDDLIRERYEKEQKEQNEIISID